MSVPAIHSYLFVHPSIFPSICILFHYSIDHNRPSHSPFILACIQIINNTTESMQGPALLIKSTTITPTPIPSPNISCNQEHDRPSLQAVVPANDPPAPIPDNQEHYRPSLQALVPTNDLPLFQIIKNTTDPHYKQRFLQMISPYFR